MPAIDPSFLTTGPEFSVDTSGLDAAPLDGAGSGDGFSSVLGSKIDQLSQLQTDASDAGASLAAGTASDPSEVVMAVERARLSMQLAAQLRTKGVEAVNEIFHTQV